MGRYAAKYKKNAAFGVPPALPGPSYAKIQKECGIRRNTGASRVHQFVLPRTGAITAALKLRRRECPAEQLDSSAVSVLLPSPA
jgi:hypothetical protein